METVEKYKCGLTKEEARAFLMSNLEHYLWHKPCINWDEEDVYNIKNGILKRAQKSNYQPKSYSLKEIKPKEKKVKLSRPLRYIKVLVTFNDGTIKQYASVKSVAQRFEMPQSNVSDVLAGRKKTKKFLSIIKIN